MAAPDQDETRVVLRVDPRGDARQVRNEVSRREVNHAAGVADALVAHRDKRPEIDAMLGLAQLFQR